MTVVEKLRAQAAEIRQVALDTKPPFDAGEWPTAEDFRKPRFTPTSADAAHLALHSPLMAFQQASIYEALADLLSRGHEAECGNWGGCQCGREKTKEVLSAVLECK